MAKKSITNSCESSKNDRSVSTGKNTDRTMAGSALSQKNGSAGKSYKSAKGSPLTGDDTKTAKRKALTLEVFNAIHDSHHER